MVPSQIVQQREGGLLHGVGGRERPEPSDPHRSAQRHDVAVDRGHVVSGCAVQRIEAGPDPLGAVGPRVTVAQMVRVLVAHDALVRGDDGTPLRVDRTTAARRTAAVHPTRVRRSTRAPGPTRSPPTAAGSCRRSGTRSCRRRRRSRSCSPGRPSRASPCAASTPMRVRKHRREHTEPAARLRQRSRLHRQHLARRTDRRTPPVRAQSRSTRSSRRRRRGTAITSTRSGANLGLQELHVEVLVVAVGVGDCPRHVARCGRSAACPARRRTRDRWRRTRRTRGGSARTRPELRPCDGDHRRATADRTPCARPRAPTRCCRRRRTRARRDHAVVGIEAIRHRRFRPAAPRAARDGRRARVRRTRRRPSSAQHASATASSASSRTPRGARGTPHCCPTATRAREPRPPSARSVGSGRSSAGTRSRPRRTRSSTARPSLSSASYSRLRGVAQAATPGERIERDRRRARDLGPAAVARVDGRSRAGRADRPRARSPGRRTRRARPSRRARGVSPIRRARSITALVESADDDR